MVWKEADFFFFLVPPPSAVETETIGYSNFAERSLQRLFDLPTTYLHCTSTLFRHVATRGGIALSLFMQCTFFFIYIQKKCGPLLFIKALPSTLKSDATCLLFIHLFMEQDIHVHNTNLHKTNTLLELTYKLQGV